MGARIEGDDLPIQHMALGGITAIHTHRWYYIRFVNEEVETLVTHDPAMVESWITETLAKNESRISRLIVGLDTEWFTKGRDYSVAVLQLCVGKSCLVYQILHSESERIPTKLRSFLENPGFTFVGVGIKDDVQKLWKDYGLRVVNARELGPWTAEELGREELRGAGLKRLAEEVVGEEMGGKSKRLACSRWDKRVLTTQQVAYACGDAYYSFEIGRRLSANVSRNMGRRE